MIIIVVWIRSIFIVRMVWRKSFYLTLSSWRIFSLRTRSVPPTNQKYAPPTQGWGSPWGRCVCQTLTKVIILKVFHCNNHYLPAFKLKRCYIWEQSGEKCSPLNGLEIFSSKQYWYFVRLLFLVVLHFVTKMTAILFHSVGYLTLLTHLTKVGDISREQFEGNWQPWWKKEKKICLDFQVIVWYKRKTACRLSPSMKILIKWWISTCLFITQKYSISKKYFNAV